MDSWGVAALVDEPGALIAAFVAHHLELGAAQVHVLLDRPNEEARDLLSGVPGAVLTDAGADGWAFQNTGQNRGRAPRRHLMRQKYHASRVLAQSGLDWVLHCDADEFLMPVRRFGLPAPSVALLLSLARRRTDWVHVGVAERVRLIAEAGASSGGLLDGPFRLPWPEFPTLGRTVYDRKAMEMLNVGLAGHHLGKGIARAGRGHFLGIHQPMRDYGGEGRDLVRAETGFLRLLHFDGLTLLHYALKMVRRALADRDANPPPHGAHRRAQFSALAAVAGDAAAIREQWLAARCLSPAQAGVLRARGVLWDVDPQIAARIAHRLPAPPDLSAAAFDSALIAREAALIARAAEAFGFDPEPLRVR